MFNLFRSGEKVKKYLLGALLLAVAASMVTYLIPNYNYGTTSDGTDGVVAEVGDQRVTSLEVQNGLERIAQGNQLPEGFLATYAGQYVNQLIDQRALIYQFQKLGITVTDDEVLVALMGVFPQFFENGKLSNQAALEQQLAAQGTNLQEAIDTMRTQLLLRKIQNTALAGVVVSPQEVDQALLERHQKATIEYIAFPPAKFRDQVKLTPEELRKDFDSNRAAYMIPEKRSFQVLLVDQAKIEQSMNISDAQLRSAYSASMDNFRMPERVKVRHILIMTQGKSDSEKKSLLAKAQDVLKQVKNGGNFADLAKKYSEDPGSKDNGGDLGFIVRGQTVPNFEKFAFSAKPNEISDIITTEYGYHIIQVLEKEPARVKPFEEVKASIADQLKKEGINEKMQMIADQAHDALVKAPDSAAAVAKQFDLQLITADKETAGQPIPGLGASPEVDNAVASLKPKEVSPVMVLQGNRMAMVVLNDRTPAKQAEFAEVQDQVRDRAATSAAAKLADEAAKTAAMKIQAGEDIGKVAKSFKLEVTKSSPVTTSDSIEGLGTANQVADAFKKPVGTVVGPVMVQGRDIVYKIVDRDTPDVKNFASERQAIIDQLKQQKSQEQFELLVDSVTTALRNQGKLKIHQDTVSRLLASYRGK